MATIAYDASTASSNPTFSHTIAIGASRILFVQATVSNGQTVSGITYAGSPMTAITSKTGTSATTYLYYLLSPTSGTNSVVVTHSGGGFTGVAASYTGAKQSGQPDASGTAGVTATASYSQAVTTVADNCWAVWAVVCESGFAVTAGSNTVLRQGPESGFAGTTWLDSGTPKTPAGSFTLAGTSTSQGWFSIIASVAPDTVDAVTTEAVTSIATTTATGNGTVATDNGYAITERGIVWSLTTTPTTSNFKGTASGTTGAFTVSMTGLTANTLYYVRAYSINAIGTTYGDQETFTTAAVPATTVYKDIDGVSGSTYAVSVNVGGSVGSVTVSLGSTGTSQVINAGSGVTVFQGTYGGLNGLTFVKSATFNGYIEDVMWVLVVGDATINWTLDTLTNVFPINSSVLFKRLEDKDFDRFRIYRYLDIKFKDLTAYVTVELKKEAHDDMSTSSKQFLVTNVSGETLPFINKRVSILTKNYGMRIGLSHNRIDETFTVCQFVISGMGQPRKEFDPSKIISVQ